MWTYFILFLSIIVLVGVFLRKAALVHLKKVRAAMQVACKKAVNSPEEEVVISKVSKSAKVKIASLLEKAEQLLANGEEGEAIKVFIQALSFDDNNVDVLQKLAMLYLQKQMYSAASALFKQLSDLTKDPLHYSNLGFVLYQQSSLEEARDAYQKAVDLDPSRPQRFVSLAQVYRSLSQPQNAIIALTKAIELDGENIEFLLLLTELYAELNNIEEAEIALRNALEKAPENEEALNLLKKLQKEKEDKKSGN